MRVATIALVGLIVAIVAVTAIWYVATPVPPYGFYYDLGVNIWATSVIAASIRGMQDLVDAIGWAGWGNVTQFTLNPMATYALTVPLTDLLRSNAATAVKATQMIEIALAGAAMALLYVQVYGRTNWGALAGLLYALAPQVLLMIRGNLDFGLAVALAPLCIAIPVFVVQRFGIGALPLSGALAGLLSLCVNVEFVFFHGIPAFCIAATVAFEKRLRHVWPAATAGGFLALMFCGAYVAFATVAAGQFFSSAATTVALLSSGELSRYGEGVVGAIALVMNEFVINPRPEFTIGGYLPLLFAIGLLLWLLAFMELIGALQRGISRLQLAIAVTGICCALLSFGEGFPLLKPFWQLIVQVPGLNSLRTPDRFISLAVVVVILFATNALRTLAAAHRERTLIFGRVAVAALTVFSLSAFFVSRIALGDLSSWNAKEPDLARVSRIATAQSGRVISTAQVRGGSTFDTPLYGAPAPFIRFQDDLISHYEGDGFAGSAILARMGATTFVTSPNWAVDGAPFAPHVFQHARTLRTVLYTPRGIWVQRIDVPHPFVHLAQPVCLHGGPGLLEYVVSLRTLNDAAVFHDLPNCAFSVYLDAGPAVAELHGDPLSATTGITLFPRAGVLRDIDYRSPPGGYLLNLPWYRLSIDGDAAESPDGAVSLDPGNAGITQISISQTGNAMPALRMVCHSRTVGELQVDRIAQVFGCKPKLGFQIIRLRALHLAQGPHRLRVTILKTDAVTLRSSTWHVGLDSVFLVRPAALQNARSNDAWFFSVGRLNDMAKRHAGYAFGGYRWIARGNYRILILRRGGGIADGNVLFDGRKNSVVHITRSGLHALQVHDVAYTAAVIALVPTSWPIQTAHLTPRRVSNIRWAFDLDRTASIEAAVFPDGNWYVRNDNGAVMFGRRCDLANTCFVGLAPGRYHLAHRWPDYITYGILATLATWVVCIAILLLTQWQNRYATSVDRTSVNAA